MSQVPPWLATVMLQYHNWEDYFIIRLHLIPLISGQRDEKFSWQFSHAPTNHSLGTIWGKSNLEACFFSLNRDLLCSAPPDCSLVLPHLFRSTRFRSALVHIFLHFIVLGLFKECCCELVINTPLCFFWLAYPFARSIACALWVAQAA